jgi:hypothetical protein
MRLALVLLAAASALSACTFFGNGAEGPVLYEVQPAPASQAAM